jgi:hypothetical protein
MVPAACSLDEAELRVQLARYRAVGASAELLQRSSQRLAIRVADDTPDAVVEELVAVERRCCPFFDLGWEEGRRRFTISVSRPDQEPALDAIADALGWTRDDERGRLGPCLAPEHRDGTSLAC